MSATRPDLTGRRFGILTVVRRSDKGRSPRYVYWECRCDCGGEIISIDQNLKQAKIPNCGCLRERNSSTRLKACTKHGMWRSREYKAWNDMKNRCSLPSVKAYKNYGGRGIKVCGRWMDFRNFYSDMGPRPDGMTLERIDNNGDYGPGNCMWADMKAQQNNKRTCRFIEFRGERKTVTQWAESLGINSVTLRGRIAKGWSIERSLTSPVRVEFANSKRRIRP